MTCDSALSIIVRSKHQYGSAFDFLNVLNTNTRVTFTYLDTLPNVNYVIVSYTPLLQYNAIDRDSFSLASNSISAGFRFNTTPVKLKHRLTRKQNIKSTKWKKQGLSGLVVNISLTEVCFSVSNLY